VMRKRWPDGNSLFDNTGIFPYRFNRYLTHHPDKLVCPIKFDFHRGKNAPGP